MEAVSPPRPLLSTDPLAAFDCGRASLNTWLQRHALANHQSGASRVYVVTGVESQRVAGFVTLSAAQIARAVLPKARQRNQPDPLPVTLLGQLAVDRDYQRRGIAASLLQFALRLALEASQTIGSIGVITHPLDESLRTYYAAWGFEDLPFDPARAMIVRMKDIKAAFARVG